MDVNDNPPVLHLPQQCLNITEFHEPGQPVSSIHASDADDPETPNGQVSTTFLHTLYLILVLLVTSIFFLLGYY